MTDFGEIARSARAYADAEKAKADADKAAADKEKQENRDAAEAYIRANVLPILNEAKHAFELEGVGCSIKHYAHFAGLAHGFGGLREVYSATFHCFDSNTTDPGKYNGTKGEEVRFQHDGKRIEVTYEWQPNYIQRGEPPEVVIAGAKAALESYLKSRSKG